MTVRSSVSITRPDARLLACTSSRAQRRLLVVARSVRMCSRTSRSISSGRSRAMAAGSVIGGAGVDQQIAPSRLRRRSAA